MKKRILFLIGNLESGGVSKSMVSLLNIIDKQKYDVSLWIASPQGVFMPQVSVDVTILFDKRITALSQGFVGVVSLLKQGYLILAFGSLVRIALSKVSKPNAGRLLASLMPIVTDGEYDLIVDYNGQQQLYYMVNKLKGKKKVTFFHSDYSQWPFYYTADKKYFSKVDGIFTISQHCVEILKKWFPKQADKIHLMENITSPTLINKLAEESFKNPWHKDAVKLITVGHVVDAKGSHWAIEAVHILKKRGVDVDWAFVGSVSDVLRYNKMVEQWNLQDNITFVGITPNPYPYIKAADIFVHPSQFEGKSIALDEAKLLCKPVVVTNFSTVHDQFIDRVNATICEMNPVAIANAIEELAKDEVLRKKYVDYLQANKVDNTSEINKIYDLINL